MNEKIYQQRRMEDEPATAPGKTTETIRELPIAVGQSVPVLHVQMATESMVSKKKTEGCKGEDGRRSLRA